MDHAVPSQMSLSSKLLSAKLTLVNRPLASLTHLQFSKAFRIRHKVCILVELRKPCLTNYVKIVAEWYFSTWYLSFVLSRKAISQKSHLNGFCPVCIKLCLRRLDPRLNTFEQNRQGCDFTLAWSSFWRICNFKNLQILSEAGGLIFIVFVDLHYMPP